MTGKPSGWGAHTNTNHAQGDDTMEFKKAVKHEAKLRMALIGPAGSGKTYSALNIAQHLGERVALLDTEHGSASKYAGVFQFDVLELDTFSPQTYIQAIKAAEQAGYQVLIIDSLSHAWMGKNGILELVDKAAKHSKSNNTFAAWRNVTPLHNQLVETMLASNLHLIVTMRSKTEYATDKDEKTGKMTVRKVGLAPVQRDGLEYEFDVTADMNLDNDLIVSKTRCAALHGQIIPKPGKEIAATLAAWLSGTPRPSTAVETEPTPPVNSKDKVDWTAFWTEVKARGIDHEHAKAIARDSNPADALRALIDETK